MMLSWLQVKLNIFTLSLACSLFLHSIVVLILMFCGSYTLLNPRVESAGQTALAQFVPVRLGVLPVQVRKNLHDKAHAVSENKKQINAYVSTADTMQARDHDDISNTQLNTQVNINTVSAVVQKQKQDPAQQLDTGNSINTQNTQQNTQQKSKQARVTQDSHTTKRAPVPGQFSPLPKKHTTLLRSKLPSKKNQKLAKKPTMHPKKRATPEKKPVLTAESAQELKQQVQEITKASEVTSARDLPVLRDEMKEIKQERIPEAVALDAPVPVSVPESVVLGVSSTSKPSEINLKARVVAEFVSSTVFVDPKQIKAYENTLHKISKNYSKPPGFDDSVPFVLVFKIAHATGKPHDISSRPDQVPLLVYQSAKASISEIAYPQELWGTELEVWFN